MSRNKKRRNAIIAKTRIKKERWRRYNLTFKRRLIKSMPLMLLGLLFIFYFSRTELYSKFEMSFLDTQMRLDNPETNGNVVIVEITQIDFENFFEGKTRPLNPPKLQELINAVAKGSPCVIGVDIDTSFKEFSEVNFQNDQNQNVVWASEVKEIPSDIEIKPSKGKILGGTTEATASNSGLPLLIDDSSGVTRKYKRMIETKQDAFPSFAWAVYRKAAEKTCKGINFPESNKIEKRQKDTSALFIKYSGGNPNKTSTNSNQANVWNKTEYYGRIKIPASNIIEFAKDESWQNNDLIKDKIVLIGGTYLGDDRHLTPLGEMSGVEITANVVESELRGGGIKPPNFLITALISLFDGLFLIALFQISPWWKAALYSIPAIILISLSCSFLTDYSFTNWFFYTPVMLAVLLTELFDKGKDFLKDRYKKEIKETYSQITGRNLEEEPASTTKNKTRRKRSLP